MDKESLNANITLHVLYCNKTGLSTDEYFNMINTWDIISTEMKQFEKLFLTRFRDVPRLDRLYSLLFWRINHFENDYKIKCCSSLSYAINNYVPPPESI